MLIVKVKKTHYQELNADMMSLSFVNQRVSFVYALCKYCLCHIIFQQRLFAAFPHYTGSLNIFTSVRNSQCLPVAKTLLRGLDEIGREKI